MCVERLTALPWRTDSSVVGEPVTAADVRAIAARSTETQASIAKSISTPYHTRRATSSSATYDLHG